MFNPKGQQNRLEISVKIVIELINELQKQQPQFDNIVLTDHPAKLAEENTGNQFIYKCFDKDANCEKLLNVIEVTEQNEEILVALQKQFIENKKDYEYYCFLQFYNLFWIECTSAQFFVIESECYIQRTDHAHLGNHYLEKIHSFFKPKFEGKCNWNIELLEENLILCRSGQDASKIKINILSPKFLIGFNEKHKDTQVQQNFFEEITFSSTLVDSNKWSNYIYNYYCTGNEQFVSLFNYIGQQLEIQKFKYFNINAINEQEIDLTVLNQFNQKFNLHYHLTSSQNQAALIVEEYEQFKKIRELIHVKSEICIIDGNSLEPCKLELQKYVVEVKENLPLTLTNEKIFSIANLDAFVNSLYQYVQNLSQLYEIGYDSYLNPKKIGFSIEQSQLYYPNPLHFKQSYRKKNIKYLIKCLKRFKGFDDQRIQYAFVQAKFNEQIERLESILSLSQEDKQTATSINIYEEQEWYLRITRAVYFTNIPYCDVNHKWETTFKHHSHVYFSDPVPTDDVICCFNKMKIYDTNYQAGGSSISLILEKLNKSQSLKKLKIVSTHNSDVKYFEKMNQLDKLKSLSLYFDTSNKFDITNYPHLPKLESITYQILFQHKQKKKWSIFDSQSMMLKANQYLLLKKSLGNIKKLSIFIDYALMSSSFEFESLLAQLNLIDYQIQKSTNLLFDNNPSASLFSFSQKKSIIDNSKSGTGLFSCLVPLNTDNKDNQISLFSNQNQENAQNNSLQLPQNPETQKPNTQSSLFSNLSTITSQQNVGSNENPFSFFNVTSANKNSEPPTREKKPEGNKLSKKQRDRASRRQYDYHLNDEIKDSETSATVNQKSQNQEVEKKEEEEELPVYMKNPHVLKYFEQFSTLGASLYKKQLRSNLEQIMNKEIIDMEILESQDQKTLTLEFVHKKTQQYGKLRVILNTEQKITQLQCRARDRLECEFQDNGLLRVLNGEFIQQWIQHEMQTTFLGYLIGDSFKPSCPHCDYVALQQQLYKNQPNIESLNITFRICEVSIANRSFSFGFNSIVHSNLQRLTLEITNVSTLSTQQIKYILDELKPLSRLRKLTVSLGVKSNPSYEQIFINQIRKVKRLVEYRFILNNV